MILVHTLDTKIKELHFRFGCFKTPYFKIFENVVIRLIRTILVVFAFPTEHFFSDIISS